MIATAMQTFHIHIGGMVQGVGFRPYVCKLFRQLKLAGWVSNSNDGVHIEFNAIDLSQAHLFLDQLMQHPPENAIITYKELTSVAYQQFHSFDIIESSASATADILLTPDLAICNSCKEEIADINNRRFRYPFTTCLHCGPRYSIAVSLPYDRRHTSMAQLPMCNKCIDEYSDINDCRHHSQTNSCPSCGIPMHLYTNNGKEISNESEAILKAVNGALEKGKIVAVKGIGGYLLLCNAANSDTIKTLRERKNRPAKPFAIMYKNVEAAIKDVAISDAEKKYLQSKLSPIVLCNLLPEPSSLIDVNGIAPGLVKMGVMLPYSPLLYLIAADFGKPLVATSGNVSGSPIIYKDKDALQLLGLQADLILTFDREIVTSQDDSVVQLTKHQQPVILRRSRGLAPGYFPNPFTSGECILATGAELKNAFALLHNNNLFVSQFLGDQKIYESQLSFQQTVQHLLQLLKATPTKILVDTHPNYEIAAAGKAFAKEMDIPLQSVQHHTAHACAVLAENDLLNAKEKILTVVWDGTGFGEDEQIWGGEFFVFGNDTFNRVAHVAYFPHLLGDKMSRQPRISGLSLLFKTEHAAGFLQKHFNKTEQQFYTGLINQPQHLFTSSMGRVLDGIAAILDIQSINTYEAEASMKLEAVATRCKHDHTGVYNMPLKNNELHWSDMLSEIFTDLQNGLDTCCIAKKVFAALAAAIATVAKKYGIKKIACSGGVFQNAVLVELVTEILQTDFDLYFHKQLSPNDECIGFGQIAFSQLEKNSTNANVTMNNNFKNHQLCV